MYLKRMLVKSIEDDFKKEEDTLVNVRCARRASQNPCGHHVKRIVNFAIKVVP